MPPLSENRFLLIYSAALLLVLLFFYAPFWLGQSSFFYADTTFYLEPMAHFLRDSVIAGHLPLWNPLSYCGMPQIAVAFPNLSYPLDWLFILFPFNIALAVSMVVHQLLAAVGMLLLLRRLSCSMWGASAGALIYSLSGYMFSLSDNYSLVAGVAWLPVGLWALACLRGEEDQWRAFWRSVVLAVAVAMLIETGRPEVWVPGILLFCGGIIVPDLLDLNGQFFDRSKLWQLRGLFIGAILSSYYLLPVAEWFAISRRSAGLLTPEVFLYSANWYDLVQSIVGPCLGDMRAYAAPLRPLVSQGNMPVYVSCAYIGPAALLLAIWGACDRRFKWGIPLMVLLLVSIIACMGNSLPIAPFLVQAFPVLGFVRFPVKLFYLPILCISVLAARGLDAGMSSNAARVITYGVIGIALVAALILNADAPFVPFPYSILPTSTIIEAQKSLGEAMLRAGSVALLFGAIGNIVFLSSRTKQSPQAKLRCNQLFVAFTVGALLLNAFLHERDGAPPDYFEQPSFVGDHLRQLARSKGETYRTLALSLEKMTVPESYLETDSKSAKVAVFQYDRQLMKPATNIDFSIADAFGFEGAMSGEYYYSLLHSYLKSAQSVQPEVRHPSDVALARVCALTDTRYVSTQCYRRVAGKISNIPVMENEFFKMVVNDEKMNCRIYEAVHQLPRAYVTHRWQWAESHNRVLDALMSEDLRVWAPWFMTYLERTTNGDTDHYAPVPVSVNEPAQIIRDTGSEVQVKVHPKEDGVLILADSYYKGWRAELDGKEVPIYRATGFNRAVLVAKGPHLVRFYYQPDSLLLGVGLSGLAVLLLVYLGWQASRDRLKP